MEDEEEGELKVDDYGNKRWYDKQGRIHRLNGPAIILNDGFMWWHSHGTIHRDDGPAVEWPSEGIEQWWKNGEEYEPTAHEIMVWKLKKQQTSNTTQTNDF